MYFAPHTHTTYSDGVKVPADALMSAVQRGFSHYAITDHDTIDAFFDSGLVNFMNLPPSKFEVVRGVELTALISGDPNSFLEVELIGLLFDENAPSIQEACSENKEHRLDWKNKTFRIINDFFGLNGTGQEINDEYLKSANVHPFTSVGKPHFVNALMIHPKAQKWLDGQEKLRSLIEETVSKERESSKGSNRVVHEGSVAGNVKREYLFAMLKSPQETSYKAIAGEFTGALYVPKKFISTEAAIDAVRKSNGVVSLPHPYISAKRIGLSVPGFLRQFGEDFKAHRIVACESDYPITAKNRKYYEPLRSDRHTKTGVYLLSSLSDAIVTSKELQQIANDKMNEDIFCFELELGHLGEIIRLRVSDCHFWEGDDLMIFCSEDSEHEKLKEARKKFN